MKIAAVMPIKLNNERLPGKNTKLLGDKPLLRYELDSLLETARVDDISVFCSDESVCRFLPEGVSFLRRDERLDLPSSNFTQIFDSFQSLKKADVYVYAHATAPFVSVGTMRELIDAVTSGCYDSAFCAVKIQDFLWQDGKPLNFDAANLPRSQDLQPIYRETSGVYVFTREVFKTHRRRVGLNPLVKEVTFRESVDVNTPEDFALAEAMLKVNL